MLCSRSFVRRTVFAAVVLLTAAPLFASPTVIGFDDPDLVGEARAVEIGGRLVVEGLWLERDAAPTVLELERFEPWAPGAVVEVDGVRRPPPDSRHFRGGEAGFLDSTVLLTVTESGEMNGLVLRGEDVWAIGQRRGRGGLASRRGDLAAEERVFECGLDGLVVRGRARAPDLAAGVPVPAGPATRSTAATHTGEPFHATVAVETDYEYYARFLSRSDPAGAALDYLASIIGYGDLVYSREIDTSMSIGFARLWTAGSSSDPWTATSGTGVALDEFELYWNDNMTLVERTTAHFFSGKGLGGGIAYLGGLCSNHDTPGNSFDYGLSANISGNFDWSGNPAQDPAAPVWDVIVVLHELGHNFSSDHTHQYCGIGGSNLPVDRCAAGCAGSGVGLPSCSSPTPHFAGGAGTIMSYCHLIAPGSSNIALSFGEAHTCGVLPERVAQRMSDYVSSRASAQPTCFGTFADPLLSVQRTGNGAGTVTSQPAGISCGATCSERFPTGTQVTLMAAATSPSTFDGWSGGGCSGTGTCTLTLDDDTTVFAAFTSPFACTDDGFESAGSGGGNDTCFGGSVAIGGSQTHALCDEDWIWFNALAGRTYRIETSGLSGGADTAIHLHADCGSQFAANDDFGGGPGSRVEWTATMDLPVDVRVRSADGDYTGQQGYTLSVTCIAGCGGCPEHLTLNGVNSSVQTIKAAQTITANDYDVLAPGDVTLHAGTRVTLGNGFSVASGAGLTVVAGTTPTCP